MAQTTGFVRAELVINKVLIDSKKSEQDVKENTNCNNLDMQKK